MQQIVKHNIGKNSSYYLSLTVAVTMVGSMIANCKMVFEYKIKRRYRSSATATERETRAEFYGDGVTLYRQTNPVEYTLN